MAVTLDNDSGGSFNFASATSVSGTGGSVSVSATSLSASLIFGKAIGTTQPTGAVVKWAAQTLSLISGTDTGFVNGSVNSNRSALYGIASPTSGAQTASASWTNPYDGYLEEASWLGSDTTTPFKNGTTATGTSTTATISVTSPVNDRATGGAFTDSANAFTSMNQTQIGTNAGATNNAGWNETAGAGSTTLSGNIGGTGDFWGYSACDVQVPIVAGTALAEPHFIAKPIPQQYSKQPKLWTPSDGVLQTFPEDHTPHFIARPIPQQYLKRPILWTPSDGVLQTFAEDHTPHFLTRPIPQSYKQNLFWVWTPGDIPVTVQPETQPHFIARPIPQQYRAQQLWIVTPTDGVLQAFAEGANAHFLGRHIGVRYSMPAIERYLTRPTDEGSSTPTVGTTLRIVVPKVSLSWD